MRWRTIVIQWLTVGILLEILLIIHIYRPEWTEFEFGAPQIAVGSYRAIDGDSFQTGKVEIRLFGVDAPELNQTCENAAGWSQPCGRRARTMLSSLIVSGKVDCTVVSHDRYGRSVSVCKNGAIDINNEMVLQGWAVAYRRYTSKYVHAEREAKAAKRGIWDGKFEMPEVYRAKNQAVEGGLVMED